MSERKSQSSIRLRWCGSFFFQAKKPKISRKGRKVKIPKEKSFVTEKKRSNNLILFSLKFFARKLCDLRVKSSLFIKYFY